MFLLLQLLILPHAPQSYFNLTPASQHVASWAVVEGVTMELTIARVSAKSLHAHLSIYAFLYLSLYLSVSVSILAPVAVSFYLRNCHCVYLSLQPSVFISVSRHHESTILSYIICEEIDHDIPMHFNLSWTFQLKL